MSIIESAFLKNKKEQSHNKNKNTPDDIGDIVGRADQDGMISSNKIVSAKENIAKMKQKRLYSQEELAELGFISKATTDTKLINEYRNLRTKLVEYAGQKNFVTLVTSVSANFNASMVIANLAATLALDEGKTSLVINADINNSEIDNIFGIEPKFGLVDFIRSSDVALDEIIYETPINRLRYIPVGLNIESSAEHFSDARMKETIASVLERYPERYIFINAPSISQSADTRILLGTSDKVILVVPYGKATEDGIRQAVLSIGKEKLAGIVLNEF